MRPIKGMTEQEVVDTIYKVARRLAPKYRFGYNSVDDMIQQAVEIALVKIETKYDDSRPLENFLSVVLRNGLFNYRRDRFKRLDKPCLNCPLKAYIKSEDKCTAYSCKLDCQPYNAWNSRNEDRQNIMCAIDIGGVDDENEDNMRINSEIELLEYREIINLIDSKIPLDYYKDWLKLKNNNRMSNKTKDELLKVIKTIIKENSDYDYAD
jgi:hypothetical protein